MPPSPPVRFSPCTTEVQLRPGPFPKHDLFIQVWKLRTRCVGSRARTRSPIWSWSTTSGRFRGARGSGKPLSNSARAQAASAQARKVVDSTPGPAILFLLRHRYLLNAADPFCSGAYLLSGAGFYLSSGDRHVRSCLRVPSRSPTPGRSHTLRHSTSRERARALRCSRGDRRALRRRHDEDRAACHDHRLCGCGGWWLTDGHICRRAGSARDKAQP